MQHKFVLKVLMSFALTLGLSTAYAAVWVASYTGDSILRYDTATGDLIDEIVPPGQDGLNGPEGFVFKANGDLLVSSFSTDQILIFDSVTGQGKGVFNTGNVLDSPRGITMGSDGYLYVANGSQNTISRYDGETGEFFDEFVTNVPSPRGVKFGPDGYLYVSTRPASGSDERAEHGRGTVNRYSPDSGEFIDYFVENIHLVAGDGEMAEIWFFDFNADGDLFISGSSHVDNILKYSSEGEFMGNFTENSAIPEPGLNRPRALTFGPDGHIYVGSFGGYGRYSVLKIDGNNGDFLGDFTSQQESSLNRAFDIKFKSLAAEDVLFLFDSAVESGELTGSGPGNSSANRLGALRKMIVNAGLLFQSNQLDEACSLLDSAYKRTENPGDKDNFVEGNAAMKLANMIGYYSSDLACTPEP